MDLDETYHKWHSPAIGRDFEMLVFGHAGYPVILFPTSRGNYYQNKDQGEAVKKFVEWGLNDGQKFAEGLGYIPLPKEIVAKNLEALKTVQ